MTSTKTRISKVGTVTSAGGRMLAWVDSLFIDHAVFRLIWSNLAAVKPGRLYRSNHPTPARLGEHAVRAFQHMVWKEAAHAEDEG